MEVLLRITLLLLTNVAILVTVASTNNDTEAVGTPLSRPTCHCVNPKHCYRPDPSSYPEKEIFVFTTSGDNFKDWSWKTITTLVANSTFSATKKKDFDSMCYAHEKGKRFSVQVNLDLIGPFNATSDAAQAWKNKALKMRSDFFADVLTINLMTYFAGLKDSTDESLREVAKLIYDLHTVLKTPDDGIPVQIACVVPWKPVCADQGVSCDFTKFNTDSCDFFIINPDSFLTEVDSLCRAQPTIPFSKLLYGLSEYNAHGVSNDRIIIGVPWHGYDFTCKNFQNNVCMVATKGDSNKLQCDWDNRIRMSLGYISTHFKDAVKTHPTSRFYQAPYYNYTMGAVKHQLWFEDYYSLRMKYSLVKELGMKGIAVLYADDLKTDLTTLTLKYNAGMWSWAGHELIHNSVHKPPVFNHSYADTVAGVSVGCLLLGTLLGTIFTCIVMRKRQRRVRQPFLRDADSGMDEFHDDDPNL